MRQIFFLTLPATLLLTAMFVEFVVPALWRRFRGRKNASDRVDANHRRQTETAVRRPRRDSRLLQGTRAPRPTYYRPGRSRFIDQP